MKQYIIHTLTILSIAFFAMSCKSDLLEVDDAFHQDENACDYISSRITIQGGTDENITLNTVRLLLFDSYGLCVQNKLLEISESNVKIENNTYILTWTGEDAYLKVKRERIDSPASYTLYAVLNEDMSALCGDSGNLTNKLTSITRREELQEVLSTPLAYNQVLRVEEGAEPAFMMNTYPAIVEISGDHTTFEKAYNIDLIMAPHTMNRSMAKVTIESISSGGASSEKISSLFVTDLKIINIPTSVVVDSEMGFRPEIFQEVDFAVEKNEEGYYDRIGEGRYDYSARISIEGQMAVEKMYRTTFNGNGMWAYCASLSGVLSNSGARYYPVKYTTKSQAESVKVNSGNFVDALAYSLRNGDGNLRFKVFPPDNRTQLFTGNPWKLNLENQSYYIPENKSKINKTLIQITLSKGTPDGTEVKVDPTLIQEMEEYLRNQNYINTELPWTDGTTDYFNDKIPVEVLEALQKAEAIPGTNQYYGIWDTNNIYKRITKSETMNWWSDKYTNISDAEYNKTFIVPVSDDINNDVLRNHEYKIKIIANDDTHSSVTSRGVDHTGSTSLDNISITIHREIKDLK